MKINEGTIDRFIRIVIGSVGLIGGGFWLGGIGQIISLVMGTAMVVTGLVGTCGIYSLCKINTLSKNQKPIAVAILGVLALVLVVGGSLVSIKITRNKFLEDFGKMNNFYKQTLFLTGQSKREEAKSNYDQWVVGFQNFTQKYMAYKPFVLRNDKQFGLDLVKVQTIIDESKSGIYQGDLAATHKKLEEVRPVFQEMFKRNGFSMLAISLTDFHDSMEKLIDAAEAKSATEIISTYPESSGILSQVEAELNDADIRSIRKNLEDLLSLAKENKVDDLAKKAAELKSSFVKVYLIKG